jgi:hypothetical protein
VKGSLMSHAQDKPGVTITVTLGTFDQEDFESLRERLEDVLQEDRRMFEVRG